MKTFVNVPLASINAARCTGCGWCVAACPLNLLHLQVHQWKKTSALGSPDQCNGCRKCASRCPFDAITMTSRSNIAFSQGDRDEPRGAL